MPMTIDDYERYDGRYDEGDGVPWGYVYAPDDCTEDDELRSNERGRA